MNFLLKLFLLLAAAFGPEKLTDDGSLAAALRLHEEAVGQGDSATARDLARTAYSRSKADGNAAPLDRAMAARLLGEVRLADGRLNDAGQLFTQCLDALDGELRLEEVDREMALCHLRRATVRLYRERHEGGYTDVERAMTLLVSQPDTPETYDLLLEARIIRVPLALSVAEAQSDEFLHEAVCDSVLTLLPEIDGGAAAPEPAAMQIRFIAGNCLADRAEWGTAMENLIAYSEEYAGQYDRFGRLGYVDSQLRQFSRERVTSRYTDVVWYNWDGCGEIGRDAGPVRICLERSWYPAIPEEAMAANRFGFADIAYGISAEGQIENIRVLRSWPDEAYGEAAAHVMSGWLYKPPLDEQGEPVAVDGLVELFSFDPERADGM